MLLEIQEYNRTKCTLLPLLKDRLATLDQGLTLFACVIATNYVLWSLVQAMTSDRYVNYYLCNMLHYYVLYV